MFNRSLSVCLAAGLALSVVCVANAGTTLRAIYTAIPGDPTSQVPGKAGAEFGLFERPYRSESDEKWILRARTGTFIADENVIIAGEGGVGDLVVYEGQPAPWAPGEVISTLDIQCGINAAGQFVFGSNTNNGPNDADEYLITGQLGSSALTVALRQDDEVPGFPGVTHGDLIDDEQILADGTIAYRTINAVGLPSDEDTLLVVGDTVIVQEGITIPAGQLFAFMEPWDAFDFQGFYVSADGSDVLIDGDVEGDTIRDEMTVYNGTVVLQESGVISGFVNPIAGGFTGIRESYMMSNGDWFSRGTNSGGGQDWVVRNSLPVAATGLAIHTGTTEKFADGDSFNTFLAMAGNNLGDYVIACFTDNADPNRNTVLLLNRVEVILREGDPVDVDNNGAYDDDAFLAGFHEDQMFMTDNGSVYFIAFLRDGMGAALGEAFLRLIPDCVGDTNGDLIVDVDDLNNILSNWLVNVGVGSPFDLANNDGIVDVDDLNVALSAWGTNCG
ncbi:MAG: hypothetical protein H6812_10985 [Phycisphaeraceae bacterium]|nr:hypothetical protein [Phycisphaerales bacterium]MCB9843768.1 hypothetical protein [Phycisphaeraceae bacterium]